MKIAVLVGGASPEREVSCESGKAVYNALVELGYDTRLVDPGLGKRQPEKIGDFFNGTYSDKVCAGGYLSCVESDLFDDVDLVFNALHGEWGEDGRIQALFDLKGIKYTGAGVMASSIAMDKNVSKILFKHVGVNTARWTIFEQDKNNINVLLNTIESWIKYPCIIKPNNQGSTIGLSICEKSEDVAHALFTAGKYSDSVMIEEFIEGREIEVGIINGKPLPLIEIKPKHRIYDYECKYTDGMSEYEVPAKLPEELTEHIQEQALKAYHAVECKNYGRVDFKLNAQNEAFCLEVNTLPGLTNHSLLPKMAKAAGYSFNEMINTIVRNSI